MAKIIQNVYPLTNKMSKDLLHISNLALPAFWRLHYGDSISFSIDESFVFAPNSSGQVPQYKRELFVQKDHTYFLCFEVHCIEYHSGKFGIGLGGSKNSLSVLEKTPGFILKQQIFQFKETRTIPIYFGGMNQANLSGVIKNVVMIDMDE